MSEVIFDAVYDDRCRIAWEYAEYSCAVTPQSV